MLKCFDGGVENVACKVFRYDVALRSVYDPNDKAEIKRWHDDFDEHNNLEFIRWVRDNMPDVKILDHAYCVECRDEFSPYYWRFVWRPVDTRLYIKVDKSVSRAARCEMSHVAYDIGGINLYINRKQYPLSTITSTSGVL